MPAADGRPRFVLAVEPVTNTVTVGPAAALDTTVVTTGPASWLAPPAFPLRCAVQLRAHGTAYPCEVSEADGGLTISLGEPARGVAPGQAAVLYAGDRVLGAARVRLREAVASSR